MGKPLHPFKIKFLATMLVGVFIATTQTLFAQPCVATDAVPPTVTYSTGSASVNGVIPFSSNDSILVVPIGNATAFSTASGSATYAPTVTDNCAYPGSLGSVVTETLPTPACGRRWTKTWTATDVAGNTRTSVQIITEGVVAGITGPTTACQNGPVQTLTGTMAGGTTNYTYTWTTDLGTIVDDSSGTASGNNSITTAKFTPGATSGTATVTLTVTDAGNGACVVTTTHTIVINDQPSQMVGFIDTSGVTTDGDVCIGHGITLFTTPSGGTMPYTHLWSPGGLTTDTISVSPAVTDTFFVMTTDANGCVDTSFHFVEVHPLPTITSVVVPTTCAGTDALVTLNGLPNTPSDTISIVMSLDTGGVNVLMDTTISGLSATNNTFLIRLPLTANTTTGTINIDTVRNDSTGCFIAGSPIVTTTFTIQGSPNILTIDSINGTPQDTLAIRDTVCIGDVGIVTLTGDWPTNGSYQITYNLSGANTFTGATATFNSGGIGTQQVVDAFTIPAAFLTNPGATDLQIVLIEDQGTGCAVPDTTTRTFHVISLPTITDIMVNDTCIGNAELTPAAVPPSDSTDLLVSITGLTPNGVFDIVYSVTGANTVALDTAINVNSNAGGDGSFIFNIPMANAGPNTVIIRQITDTTTKCVLGDTIVTSILADDPVTIHPIPDTTNLAIVMVEDTCIGIDHVGTVSGNLADGTYTLFYTLTVGNTGGGLTTTLTIANGTDSSFVIPATVLPDTSTTGNLTVITLDSIVNNATGCQTAQIVGVADSFAVQPVPVARIELAPDSSICTGDTIDVIVTLLEGDTSFTYTVDVSTGAASTSGNATITRTTVTSPDTLHLVEGVDFVGTTLFELTQIIDSNNCVNNSPDSSVLLIVNPVPTVDTLTVSVDDICLGDAATVTVLLEQQDGTTPLTTGTYAISYHLTGGNVRGPDTVTVTPNAMGIATFGIPADSLTGTIPSGLRTLIHIDSIANIATGCFSIYVDSQAMDSFRVVPPPTLDSIAWIADPCKNTPLYVDVYMSLDTANPTPPMVGDSFAITYNIVGDNVVATHTDTLVYTFSGDSIRMCIDSTNFQNAVPLASVTAGQGNTNIFTITHIRQLNFPLQCGQNVNDTTEFDVDPLPEGTPITIDPIADVCEGDSVQLFVRGLVPGRAYRIVYTAHSSQLTGNFSGALTTGNDTTGTLIANGSGAVSFFTDSLILLQDTMAVTPDSINIINVAFAGPDLFCDTTINRISAPFNVINRLQLDTISVDSAICFGDSVVVTLHGFTPKDSAVQVTYDLRGAVVATNVLDTIMPGDSTFTIFATALTSTGQVVVEVTDLEYTTVTPSCPQTLVGEIDTIIINVLPDTLSLGVTVTDGCFGDSVTVTITGLTPTTDYKFTFDVSHGNDSDTATEFVSDTLMSNVGGIITFNLPTGNLSTGNLERIDSSGAASLMIDSVLFTGTGCGIRIHVPVRDSFYLDSIPTIDSVWAGNICVGDSNVVNLTGLAPNIPAAPGITVEYYVDGPNTIGSMAARATATVGTDANGNAAFTITGANLPNANISIPDTVHIFRIINNASGCLDTVNLIDTFIVHPLPDPVLTTISIDDVCQGDSALIIINTGNLLNDSTYLITYEYDMNNNDVMDVGDTLTALVTISGPTDTIVIPAANLPTAAFPLNPEDSIDVRIIRIAYTDTLGCSIVTNIAAMFDHIPAPDSFTVNFRDSIICVNDTAWVNIDTVGLQDGTYNFYYTLIRGSGDTVNLTAPGVVIDGSLTPNGSFPVLSAFYGGNGVKYIRVDSLENVVQGCIRRVVSNMDSVFVDSLPNLTGLTISIGDICTDSIQTQPFSTLHLATSDSIRVDITNSNLAARDYCVVYSVYHPTIDSHLFLLDTVTIDTNGLGFFMVPGDSIASAAAADSSMTVHITVDSIYNSNLGCMCGVPVIGVRDSFLVHPNPLVDSMVVAVRDTSCYGDGTITVEIHTDFVSDTLANGTYQFIYLIDQNDSTGTTYEFRDTTGNVVINDDNGPGADGTFTVSTDSLGQTPLDSFANRRIRILGVINPVTGCFDSINTVIDSSFLYNHDPDTTNFMFTVSDTCENNYVRVSLNDNLDGAPNNAVRGRYIITYDLDVNNDGTYDSIGLQQGHIASDTTFYLDSTITLNITTATTMVMKITAIQDTLVDSTTCGISNLCLTDTFVIYPNPEEVTFDDVVAGCSTGDSVGIIVNNAQPGIIYNIGIARGNPVIDTVTYTISNTTGSTTNLLWKIAKTDVDSLLTNQAASVTANGYAIVHVLAYSINSNGDTLCPLVMADSVRFLDSTIMLGQPTLTPSDIELCETETSTITSTIYTGTTVVYDWSNSEPGHGIANTIVLNNNQIVTQPHDSGVYTIRLTVFVDGCATNESEVNITVHTPPVVTPQAFDIKCGDPDSLVLEPIVAYLNAPATFQWTGPAGFSSVNPTDVIYNPTSANTGTYTLVVTDSVGCTTQNSVTVLVTEDISQPVITSTPVGKVCENTSVTLNATTYTDPQISSVIYAWTLPNGMIDTTTVPQLSGVASIGAPNAGQLQAGNYSVEVTVVYNNNPGDFCSKSSGTFVLDVDSIPTVVISIADSVLCEGENLVVTVDTPANVIQYTWVGPNGFTQTSTTTGNLSLFTLTPPQAGTYTLTVQTAAGCSASFSKIITVTPTPSQPTITASDADLSICNNEAITLTSPIYSGTSVEYRWTGPGAPSGTSLNQITVSPQGDTTYSLIISVNGCLSDTAFIAINVDSVPTFTTGITTNITDPCVDGTDSLVLNSNVVATTGQTFSWTGPNGFTSTEATPVIQGITSLNSGTYTVKVSTPTGCEAEQATFLTFKDEPGAPALTATELSICLGESTTLSIPTYNGIIVSYDWFNNPVNANAGLPSATNNNTITVTPNAIGTYIYQVAVTVNGCTSDTSSIIVVVNANPALVLDTLVVNCAVTGTNLNLGTAIDMGASTGLTNPTTYMWVGPNGFSAVGPNPTINNISSTHNGVYTLTATNADGCSDSESFTVAVTDGVPTVTVTASDDTPCTGDIITITATDFSSDPSLSYAWSATAGNATTRTVNVTALAGTTTYTVTVTRAGTNCISVDSVVVTGEDAPNIAPLSTASDITCLDGTTDVTIDANVTGASSYSWTGPNGFFSTDQNALIGNATSANSGPYVLTATSANNGCTSTSTFTLTITDEPAAPTLTASNLNICLGEQVTLTGTNYNVGTIGSITYNWTGTGLPLQTQSNQIVVTPTLPVFPATTQTYTYSVTIDGCVSETGSVTISVEDAPLITAITTASDTTCLDGTTNILLEVDAANPNTFDFLWSGPNGFSSTLEDPTIVNATSANSGIYTVTATSGNGCTTTLSQDLEITDQPQNPTLSVDDATICLGESVILTGTNYNVSTGTNISYTWTAVPNAGLPAGDQFSTLVATPTAVGSYTYQYSVTIDGCTSTIGSVSVTVEDTPTITIAAITGNVCVDGTTDIALDATNTGTQAITYAWSGPNGFSANTLDAIIVNATSADNGQYTLVSTSANGCQNVTSINVDITDEPVAPTLNVSDATICDGESITLTGTNYTVPVSGNITYNWAVTSLGSGNGGLPTALNSSTIVATPNGADTYTYTYSATIEGCQSDVTSIVVVVEDAPTIAPFATGDTTCVDGTTDMSLFANSTGTPVVTWAWSGPAGFTSNIENPIVSNITAANSGTYTLVATSANGCMTTNNVNVNITDEPTNPTLTASDMTICLGETVTLTGTPYSIATNGSISYNWSVNANGGLPTNTDASTLVAEPTMAGTYNYNYSVTIDGCQSTIATVSVFVQDAPTIAPSISGNLTCVDGTTDAQLHDNSTGTPIVTWLWNGPNGFTSSDTTPTLSNITSANSGTYTLTATSANGCITTDNVNVNITDEPANPILGVSDATICLGESVILTGTSYNVATNGSITYNWSETANGGLPTATQLSSLVATPTAAGTITYTYSVTIDGCQSSDATVTITVQDAPTIDPQIVGNLTCVDGTTDAQLQDNSTGTPIITWLWTGPNGFSSSDTTPTLSNITSANSGTYTLTATSLNGCTTTDNVNVNITDEPVNPNLLVSDATICDGESVTLTGTSFNVATNGTIVYNWSVNAGGGLPANDQASTLVATPTGGSGVYTYQYSVTIDGCTSEIALVTVTVEEHPTIDPQLAPGSIITCVDGTTDVTLNANSTSVDPVVTWAWSGPAGFSSNVENPVISNITSANSGTYTLVATTAFGCSTTDFVNVNITDEPAAPTLTVSDATICLGDEITLTGTNYSVGTAGTIQYNWAGDAITSPGPQSSTIVVEPVSLGSLTYTYFITIDGCDSETASVTIFVEDAPVIAPSVTGNLTCVDGTTDMQLFANSTGTPVVSWAWSGPAGFTSIIRDPIISNITSANSGTYSLVATSANGCSTTELIDINITDEPVAPTLTASDETICLGDEITLTGTNYSVGTSGTIQYNWAGNNIVSPGPQSSTIVVEPTSLGNLTYTYNIMIDGCPSEVATVTINVEDAPTVSITPPTGITCVDGTTDMTLDATITGTPAVTTVWSGPAGFSSNDEDALVSNITSANSGTYTLVSTSANGCQTVSTIDVNITDEPAAPTLTSSDNTICLGDEITLTGTNYGVGVGGTIQYNWTGDAITSPGQQSSTINVTPVTTGLLTYTYFVTIDGCDSELASVIVNVEDAPIIAPSVTGDLTCVDGTTDINLFANSTGTPVVTYAWSGPNNFTSNVADPIISNITSANSGTYSLVATSANGCSTTELIDINITDQPADPTLNASDATICLGDQIVLTGTNYNVGTSGNISYNWTGNGLPANTASSTLVVTPTITGSLTYTYSVTIDGCTSTTGSVTISVQEAPVVSIATPPITQTACVDGTTDMILDATITITPAVTTVWSGPGGFSSNAEDAVVTNVTSANSGTYTLMATSANGCVTTTTIDVDITDEPADPTLTASDYTICAGDNVTLIGTNYNVATNGTISYNWTGPDGLPASTSSSTIIVNPTQLGDLVYTYSVTIDGCPSTTASVTINVEDAPTVSIAAPAAAIIQCVDGTTDMTLDATITGTPAVSTVWSGPNGYSSNAEDAVVPNITATNSGTYTLVSTSANGCETVTHITINITDQPADPTLTADDQTICLGESVTLTGTNYNVGTNGTISYNWTPITSGAGLPANTSSSTIIATPTATGTQTYAYSVTIDGCTSITGTVSINVEDAPVVSIATPTGTTCVDGTTDITLDATITVTAAITTVWSGPNGFSSNNEDAVISNVTSANSGTYTLMATSANGCVTIETIDVNITDEPATPNLSATTLNTCAGDAVTLVGTNYNVGVTGTISYNWTSQVIGSGVAVPIANQANFLNVNPTDTTTYTYSVTIDGCTSEVATITVNVEDAPTYTVNDLSIACADGTTNATIFVTNVGGSPVTSWSWTGPNGYTSSSQNATLTNVTSALNGTYTVTATTAHGCSTTQSVTVTITDEPVTPTVNADDNVICLGDNVTLTSSTYTGTTVIYSWTATPSTGSGIAAATNSNQIVLTPTAAGTYTYSITATVDGCVSDMSSVIVTVDPLPTVAPSYNTAAMTCTDGTVDLTLFAGGSGGSTWSWTGPAGFTSSSQNPIVPDATTANAGSYTVTAINANGCMTTQTLDVIITDQPTDPTIIADDNAICLGESVVITGTTYAGGTVNYNWTAMPTAGSGIFGAINSNQITVTPTAADTYTYTLIVDVDGCTSNAGTVTVTVESVPTVAPSYNANDLLCTNGMNDLTLSAGGIGGAIWIWSGPNGFTSSDQNPVIANATSANAGTYTVTAISANGCGSVTASIVVAITDQPAAPQLVSNDNIICLDDNIVLTTTNYTGSNVVYNWSSSDDANSGISNAPNSNQVVITPTASGVYTYFVNVLVDGCTSETVQATVTVEQAITADPDFFNTVTFNSTFTGFVTANDIFDANQATTITVFSDVSNGNLALNNDGTFSYTPETGFLGTDQFTYILCYASAVNPCACDTATVTLTIDVNRISGIDIPNIITPNGDGVNDQLIIPGIEQDLPCTLPDGCNELIIYNQWGDVVFSAENYENDWEGTYNGQPLPDGTYYYIFRDKTATGTQQEFYYGFITIIR